MSRTHCFAPFGEKWGNLHRRRGHCASHEPQASHPRHFAPQIDLQGGSKFLGAGHCQQFGPNHLQALLAPCSFITIKFLTLHPSKNSEIINYAILGANITSKYFWGIFICNGPVAFRNGILSCIIGEPRAWVIGSES